jgi:P27 family predicted phage terminase small subunit
MAGRRPKPTAVKALAGNPGKRPLNVSEPKPPASSSRAPIGLGKDAARFWHRYAPVLAELGVLTQVDEPALQMAAEHFEVALRAARQLHDEELVLEGRDGPKKNPLAQILRDNSTALKSFMVEFGMTPASRSKIHPDTGEQPSLLDEFFAQVLRPEHAEDPLNEMRNG